MPKSSTPRPSLCVRADCFLIEVPDPECSAGRRLGRYWMPWLHPQHQRFLSIGLLQEALEERGFTVLDTCRADPEPAFDMVTAAFFVVEATKSIRKDEIGPAYRVLARWDGSANS